VFPMSQDEFVASAAIDKFSGFPVSPSGHRNDLDITNKPSAGLEGSWSVCWPRLVLWRLDNGYWGSGVTHQGVDLFAYTSFQRSASENTPLEINVQSLGCGAPRAFFCAGLRGPSWGMSMISRKSPAAAILKNWEDVRRLSDRRSGLTL
jgi:hypothetical protein